MSLLQGAHNFNVGLIQVGTLYQGGAPSQGPREYLHSKIAAGAIHDSAEQSDAPRCLDGTREAVQEEILGWGANGEEDAEPHNILWLTGPAGAGKTAIAGSIAETCQEMGLLAASYLFSSFAGSENRRYKRYLVSTLAYQIAQLPGFDAFASALYAAIARDPSIFAKRLKSQVEVLILTPLREMQRMGSISSSAAIIVVDGVDEVVAENSLHLPSNQARDKNEADQSEVISALLQAATRVHFPFRILIASRPQQIIRDTLSKVPHAFRELFLDEKYDPDSDIELFLRSKFEEIRRRYIPELPSWPAEEGLRHLVNMASGQFIYAATVIRYLRNRSNTPQVQLDAILRVQHHASGSNPLEPIHLLYEHILASSPDPLLAAAWLRDISTTTLTDKPAFFVRQLLEDSAGLAYHLLESLASLVHIPPSENAVSSPYRLYHRSLSEYLYQLVSDHPDYDHHNLLKERRIAVVLFTKQPHTALAASRWDYFLPYFIDAALGSSYQLFEQLTGLDTSEGGALAQCDVNWWMSKTVETLPDRAMEVISGFFNEVHIACTSDRCTEACLHWRLSILKFCKATFKGWRDPHPSVLLRERMVKDIQVLHMDGNGIDDNGRPDFLFYTYKRSQSDTTSDCEESKKIRGQHSWIEPEELDHYKHLLEVIQILYDYHLPQDWDSRYLAELADGVSIYDILRQDVDRAMTEADILPSYH